MQTFIISLLAKASENEKLRAFVADQLERFIPKFVAALVALLPGWGGALLKTFIDRAPGLANVEDFPGMVSDVAKNMIDAVPDVDAPFISDAFEKVTGVDVSEAIKGALRGFLR